jgi:hypothetical protein
MLTYFNSKAVIFVSFIKFCFFYLNITLLPIKGTAYRQSHSINITNTSLSNSQEFRFLVFLNQGRAIKVVPGNHNITDV